jgi:hypothetical protein
MRGYHPTGRPPPPPTLFAILIPRLSRFLSRSLSPSLSPSHYYTCLIRWSALRPFLSFYLSLLPSLSFLSMNACSSRTLVLIWATGVSVFGFSSFNAAVRSFHFYSVHIEPENIIAFFLIFLLAHSTRYYLTTVLEVTIYTTIDYSSST